MIVAAVIIVENEGMFLTVCRRGQFDQWGFPGGKVDKGETTAHAAVRELYEETGIRAYEEDLTPVFADAENGMWAVAYVLNMTQMGDITVLEQSMKPEDDDFLLDWVAPSVLTDPVTSPFAEYNRAALAALDRYYQPRSNHGKDVQN